MKEYPDNDRCLTDGEIGTLAIRLIAQRRGLSQREGRSAEMSGGLFMSVNEATRAHLERCDSCREKLMSELRIFRAYFEPHDTEKADLAIRRRIESDLRQTLRGRRVKLLFFCPDESSAAEELALAAATERSSEAPFMFAEHEDEGDLILKRERDPETGADAYYLVGGDAAFTKNAQVLVDGELYKTDSKGRINFGDGFFTLCENSIIIVFSA